MRARIIKTVLYAAPVLLLGLLWLLFTRPAGVFRMHVIANSDSAEDQAAKLAVRDAILEYERGMADASSAAEVRERLMQDGAGLVAAIEDTLRERGADYSAELHIGSYDFPDREYGGKLYPAGKYQALRVVLGEGKGKNWWCVMFPPLCIAEAETEGEKANEAGGFDSLIMKLIREARDDEADE